LVLFTNSTINEFADGLTDAVAYDVASVLSYALVSSVAPIAT
jgi:aminoglycoside/choline kinase family phosphotransferase